MSDDHDGGREANAKTTPAARKPSQRRSRLRFETLLDAADRLLAEKETTDVGLYDIAAVAGVPPASVYHLFPTKEAAFAALAERYLSGLSEHILQPVDLSIVQKWQEFMLLEMHRAIEFYNLHSVMLKLFFGANVVHDVRLLDVQNVDMAASATYGRLDRYFEMPYVHNPSAKFAAVIGIYDGIWMASYARHGRITDEFARESGLAAIAYCETFLPSALPLRDPGRAVGPTGAASSGREQT
jgi:AcrR family transcriptional regulator